MHIKNKHEKNLFIIPKMKFKSGNHPTRILYQLDISSIDLISSKTKFVKIIFRLLRVPDFSSRLSSSSSLIFSKFYREGMQRFKKKIENVSTIEKLGYDLSN